MVVVVVVVCIRNESCLGPSLVPCLLVLTVSCLLREKFSSWKLRLESAKQDEICQCPSFSGKSNQNAGHHRIMCNGFNIQSP